MSTIIRHTSSTSSFESPYVSLDLLACLNSGQKTPFHVFNDVVMPEFLNYLSKKKKYLPAQEMDAEDKSSSNDLRVIFEGIQKDLNYIKKACCNLKDWEDLVNKDIRKLAWTMPSKKEQEKLTAFKTILRVLGKLSQS
jgi:hypothetical protein